MPLSFANQLTVFRIILIPVILFFLALPAAWAAWVSLGLYTVAAVTDWLDGYIARRNQEISAIGTFLDPIADKLLVSALLLVLVANDRITGVSVVPALIILLREVAVSGLREFLAGVKVSVPVSRLAKWKTTLQLVCLGFLIVGDYAPPAIPSTMIGIVLLWGAGCLTVVTAWDYWKASLRHF